MRHVAAGFCAVGLIAACLFILVFKNNLFVVHVILGVLGCHIEQVPGVPFGKVGSVPWQMGVVSQAAQAKCAQN
jgi:hypothetical protein